VTEAIGAIAEIGAIEATVRGGAVKAPTTLTP
jgi:hypothetical protein